MATCVDERLELLLSEELASVRIRERSWLDGILAGLQGRLVLFGG